MFTKIPGTFSGFDRYAVGGPVVPGYNAQWHVDVDKERIEIEVADEYCLSFTKEEFIQFGNEILAKMRDKVNAPDTPPADAQEPDSPGVNAA